MLPNETGVDFLHREDVKSRYNFYINVYVNVLYCVDIKKTH